MPSEDAPPAVKAEAGKAPELPEKGAFTRNLIASVGKAFEEAESKGKKEEAAPDKKEASPEPKKEEAAPDKKEASPDPDPDDKVEADIKKATASMSSAHKAAFTNLRYSERDAKRKLAAAEKEIASLKEAGTAAPADASAEVESLKKELESTRTRLQEFEGVVKETRLEATDEFKARIAAPRQAIGAQAQELAEKYKLNDDAVVAAFRSSDSDAVAAITADMNEFDRYRFYDLVKGFRSIAAEEASMRQNAAAELDRISKSRREKAEVESKTALQEWEKAAPEVWDSLTDEFPSIAPIEGDDEWNKSIEGVKAFAKADRFGSLTTREKVETLYRAAAFPVLKTEFEAMQSELVATKAELAKYEKASPDIGSGGSPEAAASAEEDQNIPLSQRIVRRLQKVGASR